MPIGKALRGGPEKLPCRSPWQRNIAFIAVGVAGALFDACTVPEVDLDGKTCPCGAGFACVDGRCHRVSGEVGGAGGASSDECAPLGVAGTNRLDAGDEHTCFIRGGSLYCWGANDFGQLGVGSRDPAWAPLRVGSETDWVWISAGTAHTCGVRAASGFGALHCWGANAQGQLGVGDLDDRTEPVALSDNVGFVAVSAGGTHSCAIDKAGRLWCWGRQEGGSVGLGTNGPPATVPTRVSDEPDYTAIAAGLGHNGALREDGTLYMWGYFDCYQTASISHHLAPTQVLPGCFLTITAGMQHSCGIDGEGATRCWGESESGQLGLGAALTAETTPTGCTAVLAPSAIDGALELGTVVAGALSTCGIDADGALYCWGYNEQRQVADSANRIEFLPVRTPGSEVWAAVAPGFFHVCAVTDADEVYCRGGNELGQQGTGTANSVFTRVELP